MSLSKKIAALVLLAAAIPNRAQSTEITDLDIEIKVEPSSNLEVLIEHTGFLDSDYEPAVVTLENLQDLKEKEDFDDGYSLDADDDDNEEDMECDCNDDQNQDHEVNDYNDNADYDEIFVESEEENQGDYQKMQPNYEDQDAQAENMECNCHDDQGDEDDYDADYGTVTVESEVEDVKEDQRDENQQQVFLPDTDDLDENEDFECDCHDDQGDGDDYDADYDTVFVESEGDDIVKNDIDEFPSEKKQPNLRAPIGQDAKYGVTTTLEDGEEVMVLVTYDQIMATLTEEEKEVENATGEPFFKRMYDLILGKETQKELEEHHIFSQHNSNERRPYYDGL